MVPNCGAVRQMTSRGGDCLESVGLYLGLGTGAVAGLGGQRCVRCDTRGGGDRRKTMSFVRSVGETDEEWGFGGRKHTQNQNALGTIGGGGRVRTLKSVGWEWKVKEDAWIERARALVNSKIDLSGRSGLLGCKASLARNRERYYCVFKAHADFEL